MSFKSKLKIHRSSAAEIFLNRVENRQIDWGIVAKMVSELNSIDWFESPIYSEPLIIEQVNVHEGYLEGGILINGQHRILALVLSLDIREDCEYDIEIL